MNIGEACRRRLVSLCDEHHMTLNMLSNVCGVTQSTLNNIMNHKSKNPTVSTIKKVCDGLDMTLVDFFDDPIFKQTDQEVR